MEDQTEREKREKSVPMEGTHALALVNMYLRDETIYHGKMNGGSKKNNGTDRKRLIEKWEEELQAIGCERSTEQITARIKGDLNMVRNRLSDEKQHANGTGGGPRKIFKQLDIARHRLYEHLSGSSVVKGIDGGIESGVYNYSKKVDGRNSEKSNEKCLKPVDEIYEDYVPNEMVEDEVLINDMSTSEEWDLMNRKRKFVESPAPELKFMKYSKEEACASQGLFDKEKEKEEMHAKEVNRKLFTLQKFTPTTKEKKYESRSAGDLRVQLLQEELKKARLHTQLIERQLLLTNKQIELADYQRQQYVDQVIHQDGQIPHTYEEVVEEHADYYDG